MRRDFRAETEKLSGGGSLPEFFLRRVYLEGVAIDVTAEKDALSKLVDSETKYRLLVENANDAIFVVRGTKIEFPNPKAREMGRRLGFDLDRVSFYDYIHPDDKAMVADRHKRRLRGEEILPSVYSFRLINDRGEERWFELNTSTITWEGKPSTLNFLRDITVQKRLEAELQQARRMEALGTLAGGIAHDFNNLLMGIQGRISMMLMNSDTSHPHYSDLKDIEEIIRSGADLTKQLLGFSRGGRYEVRATDLNSLIKHTFDLFGRTKKHIRIQRRFQRDLWVAEVDRGQFEQVLLNLFLNASEAMPEGGTLSLYAPGMHCSTRNLPSRIECLRDDLCMSPSPIRALGWMTRPSARFSSLSLRLREWAGEQVWVLHLLTVSSRTMAASLKSQANWALELPLTYTCQHLKGQSHATNLIS